MELNLSEIVWPICLLKCDAALNQLNVGEELNLVIKDVDLIKTLANIIKSYPGLTWEVGSDGDYYHIKVNRHKMSDLSEKRNGHSPKES